MSTASTEQELIYNQVTPYMVNAIIAWVDLFKDGAVGSTIHAVKVRYAEGVIISNLLYLR